MELRIEVLMHGARPETIEALREYAARRLSMAVRRFNHRVGRVTVRLVDDNGPRRGIDSRCSITAELVGGGQLFVEAIAAQPFAAVRMAAKRLSEGMRRNADRHTVRRGVSVHALPHISPDNQRAV